MKYLKGIKLAFLIVSLGESISVEKYSKTKCA